MKEAVLEQKRFGEILVEKGHIEPEKIQSALTEQKVVRESKRRREGAEPTTSVRVPADKLDYLVDMVGELVIAQARLTEMAARKGEADITGIAEEMERLSGELRDSTLNIRMIPIGTTFNKFRRLVRDLSADLGKEIDLDTVGAET
jgi:two-component system chemotaxis sensor kinase CheA